MRSCSNNPETLAYGQTEKAYLRITNFSADDLWSIVDHRSPFPNCSHQPIVILEDILLMTTEADIMAYSDFTVKRIKQEFGIQTIEGGRFLPSTNDIEPSIMLRSILENYVPWAIAVGSEKAKSEMIVAPVLLELKQIIKSNISVFSGRDFTVDASIGLSGICDFLISRSDEQLEIEAPAIVLVEAKRDSLNSGLGQCMAEMIAAQRFNQQQNLDVPTIYGATTSGTAWRFLKLDNQTITVDLTDYPLEPVDRILGMLAWMVKNG